MGEHVDSDPSSADVTSRASVVCCRSCLPPGLRSRWWHSFSGRLKRHKPHRRRRKALVYRDAAKRCFRGGHFGRAGRHLRQSGPHAASKGGSLARRGSSRNRQRAFVVGIAPGRRVKLRGPGVVPRRAFLPVLGLGVSAGRSVRLCGLPLVRAEHLVHRALVNDV
ncbi:unnamed protein product, partial [Ectocarpus sp. 12 AP-2014]